MTKVLLDKNVLILTTAQGERSDHNLQYSEFGDKLTFNASHLLLPHLGEPTLSLNKNPFLAFSPVLDKVTVPAVAPGRFTIATIEPQTCHIQCLSNVKLCGKIETLEIPHGAQVPS